MVDNMFGVADVETAIIAWWRPSQRFVQLRGHRAEMAVMAEVLLDSVMLTPAIRVVAASVNFMIVSLSSSLSSLTTVLAACFVMSRMDRPDSSDASDVTAAPPMEPDTSITRTT
jgi:hypothetical protein